MPLVFDWNLGVETDLLVLFSNFCFIGTCRMIFWWGIEGDKMQYLANNTLHDIVPMYYIAGAGICLWQPLTPATKSKYITVVDELWPENVHASPIFDTS